MAARTETENLFAGITSDATQGMVLKPALKAFLWNASFPDNFAVNFDKNQTRVPDGWFHPSEHPLMPERQLYFAARHPEHIVPELLQPYSTISVTIGKALHDFIEMCLQSMGLLMTPAMFETEGIPYNPETREPTVECLATGARGSMDGISLAKLPFWPQLSRQHFEFKTTNGRKLNKIKDLDLDLFRKTWPEYYAQAQEYMRMSGYRMSIVLMMALGFPWPMREFHIPYDEAFAHHIEAKYLRVRAAIAEDEANDGYAELPIACCTVGSPAARECPAREMCPIGRAA